MIQPTQITDWEKSTIVIETLNRFMEEIVSSRFEVDGLIVVKVTDARNIHFQLCKELLKP